MSENKENKEKKGKEWKFDDFKIGKSIGKGRFGSVYIAKEKKSSYVVGMLSAVFLPLVGPQVGPYRGHHIRLCTLVLG